MCPKADSRGTLEQIALVLGRAFNPLGERLAGEEVRTLLAELGLQLPPELLDQADFTCALSRAASEASGLAPLVEQLTQAIDSDDLAAIISCSCQLAGKIRAVVSAIANIGDELGKLAGVLPGLAAADVSAFAAALPTRIVDRLVVEYLEGYWPLLYAALSCLGIVETTENPGVAGDATKPAHTVRKIQFSRLADLVSAPDQLFRTVYQWGDPGFDGGLLIRGFYELLHGLLVPAILEFPGGADSPPQLSLFWFRLEPKTDVAPPGLQLTLDTSFGQDCALSLPFFVPGWNLEFKTQGQLDAGLAATIQPPLNIALQPPAGSVQGKTTLGLVGRPEDPSQPFVFLGQASGSRLEAGEAALRGVATFRWDTPTARAKGSGLVEVVVKKAKLVVRLGETDSFLSSLVSSGDCEVEFDLLVGWDGKSLLFEGSASLEIMLPVHLSLGPIDVESVYLALRPGPGGTIPIEISSSIRGTLGPLGVAVERLGIQPKIGFPGSGGNLGPVNFDFKFKPPSGVGLSLDAAVVKGGGYLYLDPEKGEYAGNLDLTVSDFLSLKAVGLISTQLPGGQPGFALLVIITAEFNPAYQLGYGFVLQGVGGLLGLNRAVLLDPLAQGVRTGAVNSVLFPTNVVANAPKILSDLRAIFPPHEGRFLIGPMAKIGWCTPTLINISLGVIIEIPGDVVIVGRLRAALPTAKAPVLVLQVTFVGALEFDKRRIWFFATLYESRVLFITLEGEMGLLMDFSDKPNFVLSVGGFHPRFTAPPLPFPSPARITLSLVNESWARVRADAYFAVTSNSVQMGCRADAFFGFDAFSVDGHFNFDALLRLSPVYLIVDISTGFSVKVFGVGVWGVHLRGWLEGPTPWRVCGSAEINCLFFSFPVDVDVTFGEPRTDTLPPIAVLPKMRMEFEKSESWRATLPASGQLFVSLRDLGSAEALVLHPVGMLQISQRFAPLNLTLDRIGHQKPSDVKRVTATVQAGALEVKGPTREQFAAAQYRDMDDAAKLSAPAYEPLDSGIELGAVGQPWATGPLAQRNVRYEKIVLDTAYKRLRTRFFMFWRGLFAHFRTGAAVSRATVSLANERRMRPFANKILLAEDQFTVARQADNRAYAATACFASYAEAQAHLAEAVRLDPALSDRLHVIPSAEANKAT